MMTVIKLLLIETDVDYIEQNKLHKVPNVEFIITQVVSLKESLDVLDKENFDIILLDLILSNGAGMDVFKSVQNKAPDIPIVIISGFPEHALEAVQYGVQDYLIKPITSIQLITSINYAIERKKIESQYTFEYKNLSSVFDNMEEFICISEPYTHDIVYMNKAIGKVFGYSVGKKCYEIFGNSKTEYHNDRIFGKNFGKTYTYDTKFNKNKRWYKNTIRAIKWSDGRILRYAMLLDVTEDKLKEENLSNFLEKKIDNLNVKIIGLATHSRQQIRKLENTILMV